MKLSEISATLREIGVSPVKSLGQNFLHDRNLCRWIVARAEIDLGDSVVEIGPGLGALTEFLLEAGAHVFAIEKDARLANFLRTSHAAAPLEVHRSDALDYDVRTFFAHGRVKLVGNLPYKIAGPLVAHWLRYPTPFSLVILMLQKEMADRICASPGTKNYGALSVLLQFRYRIKFLKSIPASVFVPSPDVDSAVISLHPRDADDLPACDSELFVELVRRGFAQRRKQLGKLLREMVQDWPGAATAVGVDRDVRAEILSVQQWVALANFIRPIAIPDREKAAAEEFPVVDEADVVLGSAPRGEVHGNNLLHRAVHILIFNAKGEVYLQLRSRSKDRHPLRWDSSTAGHVDAGEEYDAAAQRELREELGIDAELERVVKLPASDRTDQEFIWLYRGRYDGELTLNRTEIETGGFFPPPIVTSWIQAKPGDFAPGFAECWKAYCSANAAD